jgi:hypothetical protein
MTSLPHAISPDLAEVDPDFLRRVLMDDEPFADEPPALPESAYWEFEPDPDDLAWLALGQSGGCGPEELSGEERAMYAGTVRDFEWRVEHALPGPEHADDGPAYFPW